MLRHLLRGSVGFLFLFRELRLEQANAVDAVIEPYAGERWYERGDDGSTGSGAVFWRRSHLPG